MYLLLNVLCCLPVARMCREILNSPWTFIREQLENNITLQVNTKSTHQTSNTVNDNYVPGVDATAHLNCSSQTANHAIKV
jgi:hypothetical protein